MDKRNKLPLAIRNFIKKFLNTKTEITEDNLIIYFNTLISIHKAFYYEFVNPQKEEFLREVKIESLKKNNKGDLSKLNNKNQEFSNFLNKLTWEQLENETIRIVFYQRLFILLRLCIINLKDEDYKFLLKNEFPLLYDDSDR